MIPTAFDYERATSLEDALAKMQDADVKIIAGGHSLLPLMKLRLSEPQRLIDIARIPGLRGIREANDRIAIGATTTHHEVATSQILLQQCPVLAEAASAIGDQQVRNRGTVGGSLAHADPSADYPAVMLALDAEFHVIGRGGWRVARAQDFFVDLFTVDLAPGEILASVQFTPVRVAAYAKLYQRASHYAIVGVAASLQVSGGTIVSARVSLTGACTHAQRLTNVEQALAGQRASEEVLEAAARLAGADLQNVNTDVHASAEYRRAMVGVFTGRALRTALERA